MADAGWQRDPTGGHELRYWDGTAWTDHVSDRGVQSVDAIGDGVPPPPPSSADAPATPAAEQQPVVVVQKRGRGCLWAALIVIGVVIAGVVVFALAVNEAVEDLNAEQARHAITEEQFDAVAIGTTRADLETQLGKPPEDVQEFVTEGILDEAEVESSCIYYNVTGRGFGSRFQFCFDGESLRSKNAYLSD